MRKGDRRSTPEEIQEMVKLYQEGMSSCKIAERFGRDHATILYWIKKLRKPKVGTHKSASDCLVEKGITTLRRSSDIIVSPINILEVGPIIALKNIKPDPKPKKLINKLGLCWVCRKPKTDLKWIRTTVCSLECFKKGYIRKRKQYD